MSDTFTGIPDRDVFKASEVCEIAKVQPYVLRSWEQEFPNLGVARSANGPRMYRRADVERVLRIRELVFEEGLTLAGVRRRLDGDAPADGGAMPGLVDEETRTRLAGIKQELRSLLALLDREPDAAAAVHVASPAPAGGSRSRRRGERGQPALPELEKGEDAAASWPPKGRGAGRRGSGRGR